MYTYRVCIMCSRWKKIPSWKNPIDWARLNARFACIQLLLYRIYSIVYHHHYVVSSRYSRTEKYTNSPTHKHAPALVLGLFDRKNLIFIFIFIIYILVDFSRWFCFERQMIHTSQRERFNLNSFWIKRNIFFRFANQTQKNKYKYQILSDHC